MYNFFFFVVQIISWRGIAIVVPLHSKRKRSFSVFCCCGKLPFTKTRSYSSCSKQAEAELYVCVIRSLMAYIYNKVEEGEQRLEDKNRTFSDMKKIVFNHLDFEREFDASEKRTDAEWHQAIVHAYQAGLWENEHSIFKWRDDPFFAGLFDESIPNNLLALVYQTQFKNDPLRGTSDTKEMTIEEWLDPLGENMALAIEDALISELARFVLDKLERISEAFEDEEMKNYIKNLNSTIYGKD